MVLNSMLNLKRSLSTLSSYKSINIHILNSSAVKNRLALFLFYPDNTNSSIEWTTFNIIYILIFVTFVIIIGFIFFSYQR